MFCSCNGLKHIYSTHENRYPYTVNCNGTKKIKTTNKLVSRLQEFVYKYAHVQGRTGTKGGGDWVGVLRHYLTTNLTPESNPLRRQINYETPVLVRPTSVLKWPPSIKQNCERATRESRHFCTLYQRHITSPRFSFPVQHFIIMRG